MNHESVRRLPGNSSSPYFFQSIQLAVSGTDKFSLKSLLQDDIYLWIFKPIDMVMMGWTVPTLYSLNLDTHRLLYWVLMWRLYPLKLPVKILIDLISVVC